jgi:flagellar assembly protein FliH
VGNKKTEKFLFNNHIFDEPDIEEEDDHTPPPPPVFSEEDLETVRRTTHDRAYEQGKKDGVDQERASREEMLAQVLKRLEQQASLLFAAEHERDRIFETEVLNTTLSIFEKLFPYYTSQFGFEELRGAIRNTLEKQEDQSEIVVEVNPDAKEGIADFINSFSMGGATHQRFEVRANPTMSVGQCALYWKDGGAIRNNDKLAEEIRAFIQDTLAGTNSNVHDSGDDINNPSGTEHQPVTENAPESEADTPEDNTTMEPMDER